MTKKSKGFEIPVEPEEPGRRDESDETETADRPGDAVEPVSELIEVPPAVSKGAESLEEAVDHLRRLQAEFDNFRKRVNRERLQTAAWAQRNLVESILPVMDDFDRAVASLEGDDSPAAAGMSLIRDKMMRVLTEAGLERIATEDVVFDPSIHEALMTEPVEAERAGKVLSELVPGYLFKGHLVRPARVQVGVETEE